MVSHTIAAEKFIEFYPSIQDSKRVKDRKRKKREEERQNDVMQPKAGLQKRPKPEAPAGMQLT